MDDILDFYISHEDDNVQSYIHFKNIRHDLDLVVVQCGHHCTLPGYGYGLGPADRDHYLLHFVRAGKGMLHLHGEFFSVGRGQCFIIEPHEVAHYIADAVTPWEYYWLGVTGTQVDEMLAKAALSRGHCITTPVHFDVIQAYLERMAEAIPLPENSLLLKGFAYIILHYLALDAGRGAPETPVSSRRFGSEEYVHIAISDIHRAYHTNLQVHDIAQRLGISRSYLATLFVRYTGRSIKEYITDYRLEKSMLLLKDAACTIKMAAAAVGFDDPLYFSRLFTKKKGFSPSAYRARFVKN